MKGCILVHGLTGTPVCMASIKEPLLKAGFSVSTPCLAGHGTTIEALAKSTWQQWYETVRISYMEIKKSCEKVYYAGQSLGALLGLKLALDEGWGVRAVALLGTPLVLSNLERAAIPLVRYTPLRLVIKSVKKDYEKSVADPEGRMIYKATSLPRIPVEAVYELRELQRILLGSLKCVSNPILLVHSKKDKIAPPKNVDIVKKTVSSDIVESLILQRSEHVITFDFEKEIVANDIVEFFKRFG